MDILSVILFGLRAFEDIYLTLNKEDESQKKEQLEQLEKIVIENKIKYGPAGTDEKINRIALILKSMWELIKSNTNLTDYDLQQKIIEVDGEDGRLDGRISRKPLRCVKCGAGISRKFKKCGVCGQEYPELDDFDTL
jgi:hypothetical protein